MTVNSVSSQFFNDAVKKSGEQSVSETESSFSTILGNTCSTIGFARRADTVSSSLTELSGQAQAYLETLRQRFGDTDFIIVDFATEEQARELLNSGTNDYCCVLTPGLLEEMAADDDVRARYEALIENANNELKNAWETLGLSGGTTLGFAFIDGCVQYFASIVRDDITYNYNAEIIDELVEMLKFHKPEKQDEIYLYNEIYAEMMIGFIGKQV